jgi:hypothetical protein
MNQLTARLKVLAFPLLMGLLVIIFVAIGVVYLRQGGEQEQLRLDIAQQSRIVARAQQSAEGVEERFKMVQEAIPPADLEETSVYEVILDVAERSGVTASVSLNSDSRKKVGKTTYRVLAFTVTAQGSPDAVRDFIEALDREQITLPTLVLDSLKLSGEVVATTSIDFVVYTHVKG